MEESQNTETDLVERINFIKSEVDALQIAVMEQHTPWYKNIAVIVSVTALMFSFATTYVSYNRTKVQDIQNLKSELRSLLQRIAALPKENLELTKKYTDDAVSANFLSGYIGQENSFLAQQAGEIIKKLPDDQVSSTEYYAVGLALQNAYDNESAKTYFLQAIKTADDVSEELSALRTYSNFLFIMGQPEAGRVEYQKAMNAFSKYSNHNEYTKKSSHIWTELSWAYSEANIGRTNSAKQHISNAESIVSTLLPSPGTTQLQKQITQTRALLGASKSPMPSN